MVLVVLGIVTTVLVVYPTGNSIVNQKILQENNERLAFFPFAPSECEKIIRKGMFSNELGVSLC